MQERLALALVALVYAVGVLLIVVGLLAFVGQVRLVWWRWSHRGRW